MLLDSRGEAKSGMCRGRLIYVVGPSGAGKDTLLQYVRERIPVASPVVFAHRYITRRTLGESEDHVPLTPAEFNLRLRAGFFAMHWHANGNAYGIGVEIDRWLRSGFQVVVNGSRGYLAEARRTYPDLLLVFVGASIDVLNTRLAHRARETPVEIAQRVERSLALAKPLHVADLVLHNDNAPREAGEQLLDFVLQHLPGNEVEPVDVEFAIG